MNNNADLQVIKTGKSKAVKIMYLLGSCLTMLAYAMTVLDVFNE